MDNLKQLIKDNYENLPDDLKEVIMNPSLKERFGDIARKNDLNEAELQALKNETYFILLALETISDFPKNLTKNLDIDEEKSEKIASAIYESIFKPVEITLLAIEQIIKETEKENGEMPEETLESTNEITKNENMISRPKVGGLEEKFLEQKKSPPLKNMLPQNTKEEVKIPSLSQSKDAAIEETLRRARAEIEENIGEAEKESEIETETEEVETMPSTNNQDNGVDLTSDDLKWPGDISGVEIENKSEYDSGGQNDSNDEDLNKATILEEIEHPPKYASSPFDQKMKQQTAQKPEVNGNNSKYGDSDPYREAMN